MSKRAPLIKVQIRKDTLKFSAAHMTLFPDGTKENLHGHNYQVSAELEFKESPKLNFLAFSEVKEVLKSLCNDWDEKVLIAQKAPSLRIKSKKNSTQFEFDLCGKSYSLPADEVEVLPLENISSEALAWHLGEKALIALSKSLLKSRVRSFTVKIEESPGQGASATFEI